MATNIPPKPPLPSNWKDLPKDDKRRVARREWLEKYGPEKFRKKKKVTNENIEASNLEQYVLNQNLDKAAKYYAANREMFNYRTFRQINGPGATLVNKLRGIDNLDVFYGIKNSTLSLMRPKIRLYKVNHEEFTVNEDGTPGKITSLRQPCYQEFKFSDNFGYETAVTVQDYLAHESTKPNWRNVGLESFSISWDGSSYGIIENNIECNLVISFKSLKDIQASPPGQPPPEKGGLRYVDLILWSPAKIDRETDTYNPKHYEIKALLGYTAPSADQLRGLNLTERDVQAVKNIEKLNYVVSLSLYNYDIKIGENGQVKLHAQYRGRIETAIGTNQVNIFQNTFRLTKEGAVDISAKVNAEHNISNVYKLQTSLRSIQRGLRAASCKDEKCQARKNLRTLVKDDLFFAEVLKETYAVGNELQPVVGITINSKGKIKVKGTGKDMFLFFKESENVEKLLAVIKRKVGLFKKDVYKTFVDQLIDGNNKDEKGPGTRLFCINAGEQTIEKSLGILVDDKYDKNNPGISTSEEKNAVATDVDPKETKSQVKLAGAVGVKIDRCHKVSPVDADIKNTVAKEISAEVLPESEGKDKKKSKKEKDPGQATVQDFSGKNYKFYFIYLGDIIELACKNAGLGILDLESAPNVLNHGVSVFPRQTYFPKDTENGALSYPLKNARLLLGPMEYRDDKGDLKIINLAQFPISFNLFRAWFMKKVVRRQRSQMPLGSFLASLMNHLVIPSLGVGMPKSYKSPDSRSSLVSLTLPGKQVKTDGVERRGCGGQSIGEYAEMLPLKQVIDVESAEFIENYYLNAREPISQESMLKTSFDYLLMYITAAKDTADRRGDPAEDLKDGIYHFNIGSDMGLLKKMDFKRNPLQFLAELRSEQAEDNGVDSMDQLKFPYDTNLTLAGTSLFTPGMFYYVNPSLAGLGSVEDAASLAYKMNLGGYHVILKVITKITPNSYETKIEGMQQGGGGRR